MNDNLRPPVRFVIPVDQLFGDDQEDTELLRDMATDAEKYLRSFPWSGSVEAAYFGAGVGRVVAVFFFLIQPVREGIDRWLWVIVGDLPPAYLVVDECKTPSEALARYIREMKRWVELVKKGRTPTDAMPVNVPPTRQWAKELESRLGFLEKNVVPRFRDEEAQRA